MNELLLIVVIDDRRIAIRASTVHSVIELEDITPIPHAPAFVAGLASLRSRTMTVVDCRRALELEDAAQEADCGKAVAIQEGDFLYALLVDAIEDVADARSDVQPLSGDIAKGWSRVGLGMVETDAGAALLVDPAAMIAGPDAEAA